MQLGGPPICALHLLTVWLSHPPSLASSAIGGAFVAYAAFRSARSADESIKRAEELEHRGLFRDVMVSANSIVAETLRIDDLANRLKREYQTLATFSGNTGGSRSNSI